MLIGMVKLTEVLRGATRAAFATVLALIFLGLPAALIWARTAGIGFGVPERISRELSRGDLDVKVEQVAFDIFRGVVARDVEIREKSSGRRVARLSRVAVTPRLAELLRGRLSIEHISLAGAEGQLEIPSSRGRKQAVRISGLEGDAWFMEDHLRMPFLRGDVQGLRLEADALIAISPAVPSSSAPVRTTPITSTPRSRAAERNSGSTAAKTCDRPA